jgi:hypothetical protein
MSGSEWKSYLNGQNAGFNFNYRSEQPQMLPQQAPLPPPPTAAPSSTSSISSKPNNKAPIANQLRIPNPPPTKQPIINRLPPTTIKNVQKLKGGKRKSRRQTKKYRHSRRK